jgi:hypothetical protein
MKANGRYRGTNVLRHFFCIGFVLGAVAAHADAQSRPRTPAPGSAERQAICDGARSFILGKYVTGRLPQPIVFRIDHLSVQDAYCYFEAIPFFKDGSYIPPNLIADIAYNLCMEKKAGRWTVILDLSRSDVPDTAEAQAIGKKLPPNFPRAILSLTWRNLLGNKATKTR